MFNILFNKTKAILFYALRRSGCGKYSLSLPSQTNVNISYITVFLTGNLSAQDILDYTLERNKVLQHALGFGTRTNYYLVNQKERDVRESDI